MAKTRRTALITGSGRNIGRACALVLARDGMNIVLNGSTNQTACDLVANEVRALGVDAAVAMGDVGDQAALASIHAAAVKAFGTVDVLINNAGIQHTAPVDEFPTAVWDKIIAIMLTGPFHAIRCALPHMKQKNWGRIINTSSVHGLVGSVNKAAYVSAKHGIMGLTKVVALETGPTGITCNSINPGFVQTELVKQQIQQRADAIGGSFDDAVVDVLKEKQPSLDFITVDQIGALCVFLCSDAAAQITGVPMSIDGGWTAQ